MTAGSLGDEIPVQTDGWAIAAMVMAVASVAAPLVLTGVTLWMASVATGRIWLSDGSLRGLELARAARIVTLTWLTLQVVGAVVSVLLIRAMV